jgi:hypothetical protein
VSVSAAHASAASTALTAIEPTTRCIGRVLPRQESLLALR